MSQKIKLFPLNDEQRKHLAVTARSVGLGTLIPVGFKLYESGFDAVIVIVWMATAFCLEYFALKLLGGITSD